ncbi:MAG: hypothetical protein JW741_29345 [Sedimentisphaerales bacterium]|nr:hypothetical protein [Sedimentisphaerales bacterium]
MNRRKAAQLLAAVAVLATAASATWLVPRGYNYWRVERAIVRFESNSSQSRADELIWLLAEKIPGREQGKRILRLVLNPTATTRSTYPADTIPTISIELPFRLDFSCTHTTYVTLKSSVCLQEGEGPSEQKMEASIVGFSPLFLDCAKQPLVVGTYDSRVDLDCTLIYMTCQMPLRTRLKYLLQGRRPIGGTVHCAPSHKCRITLPIRIIVVEREKAEQIQPVSNPQLDEAMRRSFACRRRQGDVLDVGPDGMPSGRGETIWLEWTNLPVAVAFEPILRLSDGREIYSRPSRLHRIRARSGRSGVWATSATDFAVTAPGDYQGTYVLTPDPNFAYDDPAIKEIWNGTLEFPMSFSLYENTPVR